MRENKKSETFMFLIREHTPKSMRKMCNPNEFRLKTKGFTGYCGLQREAMDKENIML